VKFYSEITLPETGEVCKIQQVPFSAYYELNKFIQNNIDSHIEIAFIDLLTTYTNKKHFTTLDAFVALLFMRIISVGSTLKLVSDRIQYETKLVDTLQRFSDIKIEPQKIQINNDIFFNIKTPAKLFNIDTEDFIYSVDVKGECTILTTDERKQIMEMLPATALETLISYSDIVENILSKIFVRVVDNNIACSLQDDVLFELLKLLYKDDILACQKKLLQAVHYFGVEAEYVNSLPPAEVDILMSIIEAQEAKENSQSSSGSIPIPSRVHGSSPDA